MIIHPSQIKKKKTPRNRDTNRLLVPRLKVALFTNAKRKSPCPSTAEWINQVWSSFTMEYYSAIKEVLIHKTVTWPNLETQGLFVLNKVNQLHRTNPACFSLTQIADEQWAGGGMGGGPSLLHRYSLHLWWWNSLGNRQGWCLHNTINSTNATE